MTVVLDTTVASFVLKGDSRAALYATHFAGATLVLSFQTVAELLRGARAANWGTRRQEELRQGLARFVHRESNSKTVEEWANLMDGSKRAGQALSVQDAWIAATAAELGATLVTHDGDFNAVSCPGLTIVRYDDAGRRQR